MSQRLRQWLVGRRLQRLIAHATKIIYSDGPKFDEMFSELASHHREATPQEIHVAIRAVTEIEEEFQRLVYSKYDIRDKDVVSKIVDEALQTLDEIAQESGYRAWGHQEGGL